ncbi:MAG: hypothetical protein ACFFEN_11020 [Candidatus Thorarchaeota archaeon]
MTAQIPDEIILYGVKFTLVGIHGDPFFTPNDFGIIARFTNTACWRGYAMTYIVINDQLILDKMRVNTKNPKKVNGVKPESGGDLFDYSYNNLNLKTEFTGKLLLAKDFIRSMYVHMGFQRPMAYRTVVELHLEKGNITLFRDLSRKMEGKRKQNPLKGAAPPSNSHKDIEEWVKKTFSLDYDF